MLFYSKIAFRPVTYMVQTSVAEMFMGKILDGVPTPSGPVCPVLGPALAPLQGLSLLTGLGLP